jgi:hypothetical protein
LYLLASCTTVVLASGGPGRGTVDQRHWYVLLSDVGLGAVVIAHLRHLPALWRDRRRHRCALAAGVLGLSMLPALVAHHSVRGDAAVLRWIGVGMIAFAVGRLAGTGRVLVVGAFAAVTAAQVVVALAERAASGPVGLDLLGEPDAVEIGGRFASTGLTVHPYVLAAWCTLGGGVLLAAVARSERAPAGLKVAATVPFLGLGLTMSRAGALGMLAVLICFGVAALRRPRLRLVVAGAVLAMVVGMGLNLSGWANRASDSTSADTLSSNRGQLFRQAWGLFEDSPVAGVGPGRYVEALVDRPDLVELADQSPRPVHMVPYLLLVEGGIVVVPALLFLAWAILSQSLRAGAVGVGVTAGVLPFLLLDHLNWSYPQGLLLTGLWLGALDRINASQPGPGNGRYL